MTEVRVIFKVETMEELKKIKEWLSLPEAEGLEYETDVDKEYIQEEISLNQENKETPFSENLEAAYQLYVEEGQVVQMRTTKSFQDLWGNPKILEKETSIAVAYLRHCVKDFNHKMMQEKMAFISFEFEAYQGRFQDEIFIEKIHLYNEKKEVIPYDMDSDEEFNEHLYSYFSDTFLFEHLIENKTYNID